MASRFSVPLLPVAGIPVRMHLLLPAVLLVSIVSTPGYTQGAVLGVLLGFFAVLVLSILCHELGHAFAARREGLRVHGIMLWILGGYTTHEPGATAAGDLRISLAGIAVNLLLALGAGAGIWASSGSLPGFPRLEASRDWLVVVWNLNLALAALNLLPGIPFDGGHAVEAALRRRFGKPRARMAVIVSGAILGAGLLVGGLSNHDPWLATLGGWGLWEVGTAWRELRERPVADERLLGAYDFSKGYTSLEASEPRPAPEPRARVRERERARRELDAREETRARTAVETKERLDGLLDRIAAKGISSLTIEERAFLNEESRRLRDRGRTPTS